MHGRDLLQKKTEEQLQLQQQNTHVVVDKEFEFILGVIQGHQLLEEFRKKWGWLLNEHSNEHIWIFLFRLEENKLVIF